MPEDEENTVHYFLFLFFIFIWGSNAMSIIFGSFITQEIPIITEFGQRVTFLFGKITFQFLIILALPVLALLVFVLGSLMCGKNLFKKCKFKIFAIKYYYYVFIISLIDIISYLILYKLVSLYSTVFLITDFFTEPIYLL